MKNQKKITLIVLLFLALILIGAFSVVYLLRPTTEEQAVSKPKEGTFGEFTEIQEFWDVPYMEGEGISIGEATDCGDGNYVIGIEGADFDYYQNYIAKLKEQGYNKKVDNGEKGLNEDVYTTTFEKDNLVLTVTHVTHMDKTYVSAGYEKEISEHLFYKDEYVAGITEGAQTTMYMMELYDFGSSFVYQLKNGHFIVEDGGKGQDAPYLLDFLESLTSDGEKPVIEGWFISHPHGDHMGALGEIIAKKNYSERIYVDGIYYCSPNVQNVDVNLDVEAAASASMPADETVRLAANMLKSSQGEQTGYYRPRTGERYYFCDITVDIVFCQEQLQKSNYIGTYGVMNETSTVLMYTIDGQRILAGGDGDAGVMRSLMRMYEREYLNVDVFTTLHHGINTIDMFSNYCKAKTVLFTSWGTKGLNKNIGQNENQYLKTQVDEYYAWGKGTVALTFPYQVGSAKILSLNEWEYNLYRTFSMPDTMPEQYDDNDSTTWKMEEEK